MVRNLIFLVMAVVATAVLPTPSFSQTSDVSLRWQFPAGRKLEIEMTQHMKNAQSLAGQEMATVMSSTNYMTWEVESFDESAEVAAIKSQIDRVTMNMKSPTGEFDVDSDSGEELKGMAKVFGEKLVAMVGKPFGQTMNAQGEVLSVEFPEEFNEAAMVIGKGAMEKLIKNASPTFPQGSVSVGDSWDQKTTAPMPGGIGTMHIKSTYTYQGREKIENKDLDVIDVDMTMTFETPKDSQASIEILDQSTEGKMYFDAANGHTTSMKIDQSMTMEITYSGQKINQTMENKTEGKFKLVN